MAQASLGRGIDILVGGADLAFPHHAYQVVMAEAASAVAPFARRQVHIGAVHQEGSKMSKSTGNLTLVADLLRDQPPAAVRMLLLDRPWDEPWDFQMDLMIGARARLDALFAAAGRPGSSSSATGMVAGHLLADLDTVAALDVGIEAGGDAARLLLRVLAMG